MHINRKSGVRSQAWTSVGFGYSKWCLDCSATCLLLWFSLSWKYSGIRFFELYIRLWKAYLLTWKSEWESERSRCSWFIPQMPAVVQGRPSLSQEPEIPFRSPMWVAGMYHLVVSRMRLTGSWKRSRVKSSSQALLNWMQDPQRAAEPSILLCLALHVISKLKKIYICVCVCVCVYFIGMWIPCQTVLTCSWIGSWYGLCFYLQGSCVSILTPAL